MKKPPDLMPDLMTTQEVADLLRAPVRTVQGWVYRRVGPPSVRVGTRRLYERRDVLSWLDAQKEIA